MNFCLTKFLSLFLLFSLSACFIPQGKLKFKAPKRTSTISALALQYPFENTNASGSIRLRGTCNSGHTITISENGIPRSIFTCSQDVFDSSLSLLSFGSRNFEVRQSNNNQSDVVAVTINSLRECSIQDAVLNPTPFITLNPNDPTMTESWDNSSVGNPQYDGGFMFSFNGNRQRMVTFPSTGYYSFKVRARHYTAPVTSPFLVPPQVQIAIDGRVAMEADVTARNSLEIYDSADPSGAYDTETFLITAGSHLVTIGSGNWSKQFGQSVYQNLVVGDIEIFQATTLNCDSIPSSPDLSSFTLRDLGEGRGVRIGNVLDTGINIAMHSPPGYNGYAGNVFDDEPLYPSLLSSNFNHLTAGSAFLLDRIAVSEGVYDFTETDRIVNFALANNMTVTFGHLLWHHFIPTWLLSKTPLEVQTFIDDYITTVMTRYKGKIKYWIVVNEVMNDSEGFRSSFWYNTLGVDFIKNAFLKAHAVDPDAVLIYGDYDIDELGRKADYTYDFIANLKSQNIPIHAMGFQGHFKLDRPLFYSSMVRNFRRFADLGLKVQLTEVDVGFTPSSVPTALELKIQAEYYRNTLRACLETPECEVYSLFGTADKYWWGPQINPPLYYGAIYNDDYSPKPAHTELMKVLYGIDQ